MAEDNIARRPRWNPPHREGFSPGGRPLDYQGSQGWASRIAYRTLFAATIGAVAGLGIGIYKRQSPFRWLTSSGLDCAIVSSCFCGFQELTREIRAADPDDWANCFIGGLGSGALLGRIHGGPKSVFPTACLFATVGTGIHLAAFQLEEYRLHHFLSEVDRTEPSMDGMRSEKLMKRWPDFELPEWFPIKKYDEEAAKKRAMEKELQRQKMLESLHAGTFSVKDH